MKSCHMRLLSCVHFLFQSLGCPKWSCLLIMMHSDSGKSIIHHLLGFDLSLSCFYQSQCAVADIFLETEWNSGWEWLRSTIKSPPSGITHFHSSLQSSIWELFCRKICTNLSLEVVCIYPTLPLWAGCDTKLIF